ncbi:WXG100 family type VII secretion target [Streptomyces mirabilis]|uniref:WXG100 family type VII secretion target n=1 Tax=Streptomyces mirabilis TaxID=68239 RepID=UPI0037F48EA7
MSSDHMSVDTGQLRGHSKELSDNASDVGAVLERFRSSLEALGTPWGKNDTYAEAFEEWYLQARDQMLASIENVQGALTQTGDKVDGAAKNYETNEANMMGGG